MISKENIVISGISGRFPECEDMDVFSDRLISGECFVSFDCDRWPKGTYGLPEGIAKLRDIDKFDADFFGYTDHMANVLDPMLRILLEETYASICDAGLKPEELRGSNTGVFYGSWVDEVESGLKNDINRKESVFSYNSSRIPYHFDFRGPVCYVDNACASSLTAMQIAVNSIACGQCDRAVVVASNVTLNPTRSLWQIVMNTLAPDSVCKVWNEDADGYVKGEAIVSVFIQKRSEAKRIYSNILAVQSNADGFKREGFTYPGWLTQKKVISEAMREANITGQDFAFFEAHGTGTKAGDPQEIKSIDESICRTRTEPLIIGSIKANIGHTEGASGLASLAKVIIAYQRGKMGPTLNQKRPNPNIPQLFNGSVSVCDKAIDFNGGIVGINNFGIGGSNATLIVDSFDDKVLDENSYRISEPIPRIVLIFGRNIELVEKSLIGLQNKRLTRELLSLLNDISDTTPNSGMNCRGFLVLDEHKCYDKGVDNCLIDGIQRRPVWYVFTGFGGQWPSMAQSLMKVEIFSKSFDRSLNYLQSIGCDIKELTQYLLESDEGLRDETKPLFTSLVVLQIGFVDLLTELGVKADGIVGHSMGEIAAAYADGCITAEESLRIAYLFQTFTDCRNAGLMAAVGLSWSEAQKICFGSICVACNNSPKMVTMSGSVDDIQTMIRNVKQENIPATIVDTCGIPAHSALMVAYKERLMDRMRKLNIRPKQRTERWLSTTYREKEWNEYLCQWPSGEYFVENLCKPVLFYESISKAPKNSLFLELGPFGLLRNAIVKCFEQKHNILYKELLKKKNNSNDPFVLLSALGQLYTSGQTVNAGKLYPAVNYPVPRGTEFISPLIKWVHTKQRLVPKVPTYFYPSNTNSVYEEVVSLKNEKFQYLSDHTIDGRILFPASGYLCIAWKTFAMNLCANDFQSVSVEFSNVNLFQATHLTTESDVVFKCYYFRHNSKFQIEVNNTVCADGYISELKNKNEVISKGNDFHRSVEPLLLGTDFYKELKVRGYDYGLNFKLVKQLSMDSVEAKIEWNGQWVCFLDMMVQIVAWNYTGAQRFLRIPTRIESIKIDPKLFYSNILIENQNKSTINVTQDLYTKEILTNGCLLKNINLAPIARRIGQKSGEELVIEKYELIGYEDYEPIETDLTHIMPNKTRESKDDLIDSKLFSEKLFRTQLDVVLENSNPNKMFRISEINSSNQILYSNTCKMICRTNPGFKSNNIEYTLYHTNKHILPSNLLESKKLKIYEFDPNHVKNIFDKQVNRQNLILYSDTKDLNYFFDRKRMLSSIRDKLAENGFLLVFIGNEISASDHMSGSIDSSALKSNWEKLIEWAEEADLQYVCRKSFHLLSSVLFRKLNENNVENERQIYISNDRLEWLEPLKQAMNDQSLARIWLISNEETNGLIGILKALQKEENGFKVRTLLYDSTQIDLGTALKKAKQTDLVQNVFRHRVWASFRHISLEEVPQTRPTNFGQLRQLKFGDLSSFRWCESPDKLWPLNRTSAKQTLIDINYSPLNFKDVMHATARLSPSDLSAHMSWDDVVFGLEFVGRRQDNGSRVMGVNRSSALSTSIIADEDLLWSVPDKWSMAEASTVPCVYATAYYALLIRGQLKSGETVLIHAGTGGVGQAAINICLSMSCKVFTTVGSNEKRVRIQTLFPQLSDSCIGNSRNTSFEQMVSRETNGRGVDLVLNSLTDQMFWASLRCLAENGRFCEIGKYQFINNEAMDLSSLLNNKTFHGIYLDALFTGLNNLVTKKIGRQRQQIWQLLADGIDSGVVKPLPLTVFTAEETETAFRFMSSGKHIGKVVIQIRPEEPIDQTLDAVIPMSVNAIPQTFFNPLKSYIITGGLGGMGLELMYWMFERNARNFLLTSRSGLKTGTQEFAIHRLEEQNCKIIVSTDNGSDIYGAKQIICKAHELGTIGGIFLLTLVLEDDLIENQTTGKFERVMNAKSAQALNFDVLSRQLSQPIDYFVAFSSCSSGRGITGQTNYAFANSILERICDKRRADGIHGLAIQWGFVADVGVAANSLSDNSKRRPNSNISGYSEQRIISCWTQLDRFLQTQHSVCSSYVRYEDNSDESDSTVSLLDMICNILGINDISDLNDNKSLGDIGLDSLMSVEVRNIIDREMQISLTSKEVTNITIRQLKAGSVN